MSTTHLTDIEQLAWSQELRHRLVKELIADGLPTDNKDRSMLLRILVDADAQVIGKLKVDAKEKKSQADVLVAQAIAELARRSPGNALALSPDQIPLTPLPTPTVPDDPDSPLQLVQGETAIGIESESYDSFLNRFKGTSG